MPPLGLLVGYVGSAALGALQSVSSQPPRDGIWHRTSLTHCRLEAMRPG